MSIRTILTREDPTLTKVCHKVTKFDPKLHALLDDLKVTLADAQGMGLAAPQIGILRRVVVILTDPDNGTFLELINPEIVEEEGEQNGLEGCLSVPGLWAYVTRPNHVIVRAQDRNGNFFQAEGNDLMARCFCHEIAHLDGHLYTELADRLYTTEELDAMEQIEEEQQEAQPEEKDKE